MSIMILIVLHLEISPNYYLNKILFQEISKMHRSTTEMDDEDTINEHRRRSIPNPDSPKEARITRKMRSIVDSMYNLAGRILTHSSKFKIKGSLTEQEKYSAKTIVSIWQILNKMINDEKYRITASTVDLENYVKLLETYVKLVKQMMDFLDKLMNARSSNILNYSTATRAEIIDQETDFLNLVKEFLKDVEEVNNYWK